MSRRYHAPRGTRDILPDEVALWRFLERTARSVFERFLYREIRTPALESTELFARSVGESSDIVRKEMYTFDRGGDSLTLRPENTASVVRAFVEHSLHRNVAGGYPERYFYLGPMFRRERPQKGRQRQFHQIGAELLGASEPAADSEMIQLISLFLDELGISDRELLISSVGDEQCRPAYRAALRDWLASRLESMCGDCRRRADENPLRVFDCKVDADRLLLEQAPRLIDALCGSCSDHFDAVRREIDASGVGYRIEPRLVRGLDYYERTVFEVVAGGLGAQNAILGGGRYDGLVAELGGPAIPGVGFAMGMERTTMLLSADRVTKEELDLALVPLGTEGLERARRIAVVLRQKGLRVLVPLVERPLGAQMKRAARYGARFALFLGKDELERGVFGLKDLQTGEQTTTDEAGIVARVRSGA